MWPLRGPPRSPLLPLLLLLPLCLVVRLGAATAGEHGDRVGVAFGVDGQLPLPAEHPRAQRQRGPDDGTSPADSLPSDALSIDVLTELRSALDVMQRAWFAVWVGTWPKGIDWTRAVVDTHLIATAGSLSKAVAQAREDGALDRQQQREIENEINRYFTQNIAYYFGENAFSILNQAYDDMLWVVLGWLEGIKFIHTQTTRYKVALTTEGAATREGPWFGEQFVDAFAHRARIFWEATTKGWDTDLCGGGMVWNPRLEPYKNAITNELFISASVGMYLYFPGDNNTSHLGSHDVPKKDRGLAGRFDPRHLKAAMDGYDWLKTSGMMNEKGLYTDGFHVRDWRNGSTECNARNEMVYTYNQGVLLSGLRGLWESTGNRSYLDDGHQLARNAIRATGWAFEGEKAPDANKWAGLGRGGILEDRCDAAGNCNQDAHTFKGIFMHHLALLCEPLPLRPAYPGKTHCADKDLAFLHRQSCKQYSRWVAHNAEAALRVRDAQGRFGGWWGARSNAGAEPLPLDAIDYRNNPSELLQEPWIAAAETKPYWVSEDSDDKFALHGNALALSLNAIDASDCLETSHGDESFSRDPNNRGRGRTVESQSGGVAVLRTLWELVNNT